MATENQLRPKPGPGTPCPVCLRPTALWVADHCHICDPRPNWGPWAFRGWLCDECNKTISLHMETHRARMGDYIETHSCAPVFEGWPRPQRSWPNYQERLDQHTKRLRLVNGTTDRTYLIVSAIPGFVTIQQIAAWLGVAGPTVRNYITLGHIREVWTPNPTRRNGVRLIPLHEATRFIIEAQGDTT